MKSKRFLIKLRYLGFRYHGVQKQPGLQSIQGRLEEVLKKGLGDVNFQIRFSSRTDALVSSLESYALLMFEALMAQEEIQRALVRVSPDIEILEVKNVEDDFILLKHAGIKEYRYYFCFNQESFHPFASPFMTHIQEELDLEMMKRGAFLFGGEHDFKNYAHKIKEGADSRRQITFSELKKNEDFRGGFFPENSYVFIVRSRGFMRGQVRAMVGALFRLGKGELSLQELEHSLKEADPSFIKWLAPASGLILYKTGMK